MRLAKSFVNLTALLALLAWSGLRLPAQTQPPTKAPQGSKQPAKPSAPAKQQPTKAAPAKQPAKKLSKAKKSPPKEGSAEAAQPKVVRRDPFNPLVGRSRPGEGLPDRLPPGKAGLIISTLRLDGIVRAPNGMIVVVSNPQQRVYFLREGDQLYDGRVERITLEAVAFHEVGKDAFGKPLERQVIKRLYPSAGEQR
jgi:hypothetical protein